MNHLRTTRPTGSAVILAAVLAGLLVMATLLLEVLTGLGAASMAGDPDVAVTSAVIFRGVTVLLEVAFLTAAVTTRGLRAATPSTLTAVPAGALVAYLVLAVLSPGHVTLALLISDDSAVCLITDGVFFLTAALVGMGFSVRRHTEP